jgi:hypothetical protein
MFTKINSLYKENILFWINPNKSRLLLENTSPYKVERAYSVNYSDDDVYFSQSTSNNKPLLGEVNINGSLFRYIDFDITTYSKYLEANNLTVFNDGSSNTDYLSKKHTIVMVFELTSLGTSGYIDTFFQSGNNLLILDYDKIGVSRFKDDNDDTSGHTTYFGSGHQYSYGSGNYYILVLSARTALYFKSFLFNKDITNNNFKCDINEEIIGGAEDANYLWGKNGLSTTTINHSTSTKQAKFKLFDLIFMDKALTDYECIHLGYIINQYYNNVLNLQETLNSINFASKDPEPIYAFPNGLGTYIKDIKLSSNTYLTHGLLKNYLYNFLNFDYKLDSHLNYHIIENILSIINTDKELITFDDSNISFYDIFDLSIETEKIGKITISSVDYYKQVRNYIKISFFNRVYNFDFSGNIISIQ